MAQPRSQQALDAAEVATASRAAAARFRALLDAVTDASRSIPGMTAWTIRDLTAHVACGPRYYQDGAQGMSTFAEHGAQMPDINAANVAALADRSFAELIGVFDDGYASIIEDVGAYRACERAPRWPTHGSTSVTPTEALALLLGELNIHGWDLARALGVPWPIPPRDVELAFRGISPILPVWVARDLAAHHSASYEIRLRGQGTHRWRFEEGALTVEPTGEWDPDVVISAAPAPLTLVFYGRIGQWGPVLRGQMLAWGRKPWLALRLPRRFLPA